MLVFYFCSSPVFLCLSSNGSKCGDWRAQCVLLSKIIDEWWFNLFVVFYEFSISIKMIFYSICFPRNSPKFEVFILFYGFWFRFFFKIEWTIFYWFVSLVLAFNYFYFLLIPLRKWSGTEWIWCFNLTTHAHSRNTSLFL